MQTFASVPPRHKGHPRGSYADGQAEVTRARDHVEAGLLATFTPREHHLLRELLTRLAAAEPSECLKATGSCI